MNINGIEYPVKIRLKSAKALRNIGIPEREARELAGRTMWAKPAFDGAQYSYHIRPSYTMYYTSDWAVSTPECARLV